MQRVVFSCTFSVNYRDLEGLGCVCGFQSFYCHWVLAYTNLDGPLSMPCSFGLISGDSCMYAMHCAHIHVTPLMALPTPTDPFLLSHELLPPSCLTFLCRSWASSYSCCMFMTRSALLYAEDSFIGLLCIFYLRHIFAPRCSLGLGGNVAALSRDEHSMSLPVSSLTRYESG